MMDIGLKQVENPSEMLLAGRPVDVSGTCVACIMEGSRPILAEVQVLATKSGFASPRRVCTGFDYNRMAMIVAVLEKRAGLFFGTMDIYVNVVGGFKLDEPAGDLSVLRRGTLHTVYLGRRIGPSDKASCGTTERNNGKSLSSFVKRRRVHMYHH